MHALLTWPTFGSWLPGPARGGRVESLQRPPTALPAPDPDIAIARGLSLKWPPVSLNKHQQHLLLSDLLRIAELRGFTLHAARSSAQDVHVLFEREPLLEDIHRLVQLIKGSLARTLSVDAGDPAARSTSGESLAHQKWWARQYLLQTIEEPAFIQPITALLRGHDQTATTRIYGDRDSHA